MLRTLVRTFLLAILLITSAFTHASTVKAEIIEIDQATLSGAHLTPEPNMGENQKSHSVWLGEFCSGMAYVKNEFSIASNGYPADEYLIVKNGWLRLTDADGEERVFNEGKSAFIPKGWLGNWTNSDEYLEFVVTSTEFCPNEQRGEWPPNALIDTKLDTFFTQDTAQRKVLCKQPSRKTRTTLTCSSSDSDKAYSNELLLEWQVAKNKSRFALENSEDIYIEVLKGNIHMKGEKAEARAFARGDAFIVTRYFKGTVELSDGFEAMLITGR